MQKEMISIYRQTGIVIDMWRKLLTILACLLLAAGLVLVLFAPVSNFIGSQISHGKTEEFDSILDQIQEGSYAEALQNGTIDPEGYPIDENGNRTSAVPVYFKADLKRLYRDSIAYNDRLKSAQGSLLTDEFAYAKPSLQLSDYGIYDGIYGYVEAPSIGMKLPIYLGANDATMSYGAAHLTYTSLPVGGENTNAAIAGHTGYVGRIFFDNLRNLKSGDTVNVKNFWETLSYEVTDTKIVAMDESGDIYLQKEKDLLTLVTCISDGAGGFNRLLVICSRKE